MRHTPALLCILLASCATTRPSIPAGTPAPWCFEEYERGATEESTDVNFWPVKHERMSEAIAALNDVTIIELERNQIGRFLEAPLPSSSGRYYLVRASVYATPGATLSQRIAMIESASFHLNLAEGGRAIVTTSQPIQVPGLTAQNIAMILRSDSAITHVAVACYAIR